MAGVLASMIAEELGLSTDLLTPVLSITTLARLMTELFAFVESATKFLSTRLTTTSQLKMARLVWNSVLATSTNLLGQIRTWRAIDIVRMTLVVDKRMSTHRWSSALGCAIRLPSSTGLRRLQNSLTAATSDFVPYCLGTSRTSSTVAELLTEMTSTLQRSATYLKTDVLGFDWDAINA